MSNIRTHGWLKLAASVVALIAVVVAVFLLNRARNDSDGLDKYFLRDAKAMQEMGLPVYWLGTEFAAGDLVFRGPYGAEFGAEVEAGVAMTYLASLERGNTGLDLTVYSRDAWELVEDRMMNPRLPGITRKTVMVGDRESEMLFLPLDTRPLNTLRLVLDIGDVVVVGIAGAGGAVSPGGPDYNPFINDPDLLVQVMENLRPYPE